MAEDERKDFASIDLKQEELEPYISKEDYERLMSQGKKEDMDKLLEYAIIKFKETRKREGIIKVQNEYAKAINPNIQDTEDKNLKNEIETSSEDKKSGEIVHLIAKYLMEKYSFKTISGTKSDKIYVYGDGIYKTGGKDIIKQEVEELLKEKSNSYKKSEVINKIATKTLIERKEIENIPSNLICLNNGIFDIERMELIPHNKDLFFLSKVSVDYNPNAKCPKIEEFIKESFYEEDIKTIWEWIGFQLYRRYLIKRAVIHVGERDTGKSTFLNLLKTFIGEVNVSNISLQQMRSAFARASLVGKHSNICDDLNAEDIENTGDFKNATGGSNMSGEEKFGDNFGFLSFAKMTFACNKIPQTKDIDDNAYWSRWIVFRHDNVIEKKDQDIYLIDKITTKEELSGMFNYAIEELKNVLQKGDISYSKTPEEVKAIMLRSGNPLVSFVQDCLNEQEGNWISKEDLFNSYIDYVVKNKLPRMTKEKLGRNILRYCRFMIDGKKEDKTGWRNVRVGKQIYEQIGL